MFKLNPPSPKASGIKCKKAPPRREPTDNETKNIRNLSRVFFFKKIKRIPISDNKDTIKTLNIMHNSGFIKIKENYGF